MALHQDEIERGERIDALADRKLNRPGEDRPATEVWDEARDEVDEADQKRRLIYQDNPHF